MPAFTSHVADPEAVVCVCVRVGYRRSCSQASVWLTTRRAARRRRRCGSDESTTLSGSVPATALGRLSLRGCV